jgi:DNA topoisomerase-1
MRLVIVESPAKARTIERYLGAGHTVLASFGHVRDLEARDGAVDPEADFAMRWEVSADRAKQLAAILKEAKAAEALVLATDPDREGEAISWHLLEHLKARRALPPRVERVTFNAITRPAVTEAMARPRALDQDLIDAYRARRALDWLVGFTLSPVLWRKLPGARSAGRVQSVALRLIVEREREIEAFVAREYWSVAARLRAASGEEFNARLVELGGRRLDRFDLATAADAEAARQRVAAGRFTVGAVETRPVSRNPQPPFTTSTLQQEAARKLGMTAQQAMRAAQSLYEAGLITYMRTDSVAVAPEAVAAARAEATRRFGADHVPEKPRHWVAKAKNAQEAHEAIRPTDLGCERAGSGEEARLYDLIWRRMLASQMASARLERTVVELRDGDCALRATGQVLLFPGFLALYQEDRDDPAEDEEEAGRLPRLRVGEAPALLGAEASQHFTQPPPRYSEASLVKRLEELGIGRPSTYAAILQVLRDRAYVRMEARRFHPEEKGRLVTAFLERFFPRYVEYGFTAGLEAELDRVAEGAEDWVSLLRRFWSDFKPAADAVMERMPSDVTAALDEYLADYLFPPRADGADPRLCPLCGEGRLSLKTGRFGAFVGCSRYPACRFTRPFAGEPGGAEAGAATGPELLGYDPATGEPITRRQGRFGAYVQRGEGEKPQRATIPKDVAAVDLDLALKLLALPREVGRHPETGEPVLAGIGQYGPYLRHGSSYARLTSTAEVFEIGMNAAVAALADAAASRGRGRGRASAEPLRVLGDGPGGPVKLMPGRYGPYVTDGATNASLPKGSSPEAVTLEDALALLAERAAAGPAKGTARTAARAAGKSGSAAKGKARASAKAKPAATATGAGKAKAAGAKTRAARASAAEAGAPVAEGAPTAKRAPAAKAKLATGAKPAARAGAPAGPRTPKPKASPSA